MNERMCEFRHPSKSYIRNVYTGRNKYPDTQIHVKILYLQFHAYVYLNSL